MVELHFLPLIIFGLLLPLSFSAFHHSLPRWDDAEPASPPTTSRSSSTSSPSPSPPSTPPGAATFPTGFHQHPALRFCDANPFLNGIDRTRLRSLEANEWTEWQSTRLERSIGLSEGVGIGLAGFLASGRREAMYADWHNDACSVGVAGLNTSVRYFAPVDSMLPCPTPLRLYGAFDSKMGWSDTGKWLCQAEEALNRPQSVVYSLGSNNQFDFEDSVLSAFPNTRVYTFDCTSDPPPQPIPRLTFDRVCLGSRDEVVRQTGQFKTLRSIMSSHQHDTIHLLKMVSSHMPSHHRIRSHLIAPASHLFCH